MNQYIVTFWKGENGFAVIVADTQIVWANTPEEAQKLIISPIDEWGQSYTHVTIEQAFNRMK